MTRFLMSAATPGRRRAAAVIAATGGFAVAALMGVALAKSFTVAAAQNATVTNQSGVTRTENIAVNSRGFALYTLSGDSRSHPKCTRANGCVSFWPPLTVSSAKKLARGPGVQGKLGVWRRDGFIQLTLGGHPLYRYSGDGGQKGIATGQDLSSFGGTWHVVSGGASSASGGSAGMTTPSTPTPTTPTTTYPTTTYPYP